MDGGFTSCSGRKSRSSRKYLDSVADAGNPRQEEIWELESSHQERLNYLQFKANLLNLNRISQNIEEEPVSKVESPKIEDDEVRNLEIILEKEKKLTEQTKESVESDLSRCKSMLESFRIKRKNRAQAHKIECEQRIAMYRIEIEKLKTEGYFSSQNVNLSIENS